MSCGLGGTDLNSGTVSQDLNSMNNARLLQSGSSTGARFKYRTNLAAIRQILGLML